MRKTILLLFLLLPLLFVLTVFSSVRTVSLAVPVSVQGIEIEDPPEGGYRIDLSSYRGGISVKAKVLPDAARVREYTYRVEGDCVRVDKEGNVFAEHTGEAKVFVRSKDGGFEDSVPVFVYATAPYDIGVSFPSAKGELLIPVEGGYFARLPAGRYAFSAHAVPEGEVAVKGSEAVFPDRAAGEVLLPFAGEHSLVFTAEGRVRGEPVKLQKTVRLFVEKTPTDAPFVVDGGKEELVVDRACGKVSFFAEGERPEVQPSSHIGRSEVEVLGEDRYRVTLYFAGEREDFSVDLTGKSGGVRLKIRFVDFDFSIRSSALAEGGGNLLAGTPTLFSAAAGFITEGVVYEWRASGDVELSPEEGGAICRVTAHSPGEFTLTATALRGGTPVCEKTVCLTAYRRVRTVQFSDRTDLGLAKMRAVAGLKYAGGGLEENIFELHPLLSDGENVFSDVGELTFTSSDEKRATVCISEGKVCLSPKGEGAVTVTAQWRGNGLFGEEVKAEIALWCVGDGVEIGDSPSLYRAAREGRPIVLERDVLLGTDEAGDPLPAAEREALLGRTASTFNTEYYRNTGGLESAQIAYALEFKGNVYGNGHSLNAELFTADTDAAVPRFFRGPLSLVRFGELASVAAQDNAAFLLRTDGVTLWNLSLLGCGDERLFRAEGMDLSALNTVGTVLEVNASAVLLNCRVRNGRNVVRAYGGNRAGNAYFSPLPAEEERITVRIEGCHLSQGREFLLKLGTNAAVRASGGDVQPDLKDERGEPYPEYDDSLWQDESFYRDLVLTDVMVKDSVLERCGFFCIGVECNFSGPLLAEGAGGIEGWAGVGGTSYPAVLRLDGDVRLYNWQDVSLIDSSTLIETELKELKFDIPAILSHVAQSDPDRYGEMILSEDGKRYIHGGIAFYGGGKNYGQFVSQDGAFTEYRVNLSALSGAEGEIGEQGRLLPLAAGDRDFRFYLYEAHGENGRQAQLEDEAAGRKYEGIRPLLPAFA